MGLIGHVSQMADVLRQFEVENGHHRQVEFNIVEEERPPIQQIAAYRQKYNLNI